MNLLRVFLTFPLSFVCRFKDDQVYPWKEEVSNFVIDPKSANRSIFVQALSREDAGTYSCLIVKHSLNIIRQIPLKIFG